MTNETLPFGNVPRTFKKVKDVRMFLAAKNGELAQYRVPIYLRSAGDPVFGCAPPPEYINAWHNFRDPVFDDSRAHARHVTISDNLVLAATFDDVQKMLESLSSNYSKHLKNSVMKKVIGLHLELVSPGEVSLNKPSFSNSDIIVGIKSSILYEINGRIYRDTGAWGRKKGHREEEIDVTADLSQDSNWDTVIPYSDAAWATVQQVEETLRTAARMLKQLAGDAEKTNALLLGGMQALALAAPGSTKC